MKTQVHKVLQLWQNDDEKNRVLALELIQSLDLLPSIAQALNMHTAFQFLETATLEDFTQRFYYYQGVLNNKTVHPVMGNIDRMLTQNRVSSALMRKIYTVIPDMNIIREVKPGYEAHSRILCECSFMGFVLGFSWIVSPQAGQVLKSQFAKVDEVLSTDESFQRYHRQIIQATGLISGRAFKVNKDQMWADIARKLYQKKYQYGFAPTQEGCQEFSLLLKFEE
ncbi:MAG TPA: hypothetical protein DCS93_21270 [Microscillaceae bacterium]|nr:hypothetical protein [Microscillaceae bacterium]